MSSPDDFRFAAAGLALAAGSPGGKLGRLASPCGWALAAAVAALLLVPRPGATTDCPSFASERLVLEPVSLVTDGAEVPGWRESASAYEAQFTAGTGPGGPFYLSTSRRAANPLGDVHHEAFDANPADPR